MKNGFIKVAAASPALRIADPAVNAGELARRACEADRAGVRLLVFPELSLTGYTCGDLFASEALLTAAKNALGDYLLATKNTTLLSAVGLPFAYGNGLYNCAAICQSGNLLGIVPKTVLPDHGEFCESRTFTTLPEELRDATVDWNGMPVPFGTRLIFACREIPAFRFAAEIGADLWAAFSPSAEHCAAGATVIGNLSASDETVGKTEYRRQMVSIQSAKTVCAYLFASSGTGESTTDLVFGAHRLICENGAVLAEDLPFDGADGLTVTEIDVEKLARERRRLNTFSGTFCEKYREIAFSLTVEETALTRFVAPNPFVPSDAAECARRCEEILRIQTEGLKQRILRAYAKKAVIGISGGLDSTLALLVAVRAMDALNRPRTDVIAVTMPCFGTTKRTKNNATILCEELGVDFRCVDIKKSVDRHFLDIGHDPSDRNVTYENGQARERTQVLMDIANDCGGMVIGTGDLSELALGWATYNGDHMSMYGVNASVPKTLIRHIVAYSAGQAEKDGQKKLAAALSDVLATPVSPELLPASDNGEIAQKTEDLVGPYEIHDFYLYYFLRYGFSPEKLFRLAKYALGGCYSDEVLLKWLKTFLRRFFSQQFKRSCLPDGPKVGSVGLSPRGDWRMPSDVSAAVWLAEADRIDH